jgi:hypothetical protein
MALSVPQQQFVKDTGRASQIVLDIYGLLTQLDVLWAGTPNYDALITQGEIDATPALAGQGLTATTLGDAEFALASIKTTVTNALPALTVVARLK